MNIHSIDCCSMCPFPGRLLSGSGPMFARGRMVTHCWIVETPAHGLVLVDTGVGSRDLLDPKGRLGAGFCASTGFSANRTTTAIDHVRGLGFDPKDVRHILLTHLDVDHAGGLSDFPWATVHVHKDEKAAAYSPEGLFERERYRPCQVEHKPNWQVFEQRGEPWNGFGVARELPGLPPEILAIPLAGHTRGHSCFAIQTASGLRIHAGDSYFHHRTLRGGEVPVGIRLYERWIAQLGYERVLENHSRLRELAKLGQVNSSHDPLEFDERSPAAPTR